MEERKLNDRESLELITQMIRNTEKNIDAGGGNLFIIWGISSLIATIIVTTIFHFTKNPYIMYGWFLIPIIGYTWMKLQTPRKKIITHIDNMIKSVWIVCGVFCATLPILLSIVIFFSIELKISSSLIWAFIPWIEIIIVSIGISTTGIIIGYKPIKIAGFLGIFLSFFNFAPIEYSTSFTFIIWTTSCLIIPGIKLNHSIKKISKC